MMNNEIFMASENKDVKTRIIVEQWDKRHIIESPYCDHDVMEDLLQMFLGIGVQMTYSEEAVLQIMKNFAEERLPDEPAETIN